ncbi:hypothetical protein D922_02411 [Enterococcus faecalis 06-MB-DW-09]|nr:hypothetical protein D922_02411 [Enterococcus faecalis 06-MB-DW-09]
MLAALKLKEEKNMEKENVKIRSYEEKLQDLLTNGSYEPVEWRQSNEEIDGNTVSEVTFKFKQPTPEKE